MAPGRQASLTQVEWEGRAGRTRRAGLLDQMDSVVPRAEAAGPGRAAGEGRRRGLRAREGKRPCQIARRTFGYAKVRYRGIARGASARPRPARQRQPARVRQGREAGGVPGGLRGGRLTAAEGTVCREGARRGRERGPGRPGRPQRSEHDQRSTDCQGVLAGAKHLFCV